MEPRRIVVVGAGIIGASIAWHEGRRDDLLLPFGPARFQ